MTLLLVAVSAFLVWHVAIASSFRAQLVSTLGRGYVPFQLLASLALLVCLLWTYRGADRTLLYTPPDWGLIANFILSAIGFVCLGIFLFRGKARNILRYPLAIGVLFWGAGHLLSNGETASVVLVLGFIATVLISTLMKGPFRPSEVRQGHDLLGPMFGVAFLAVAAQMHQLLVGVPVFQLIK
jgi:uncharacterized membrane protein